MSLPSIAVVIGVICLQYQVQTVAAGCPTIFTNFNMACYYVGQNSVPSADVARDTCVGLGGYLLNVDAGLEFNYTVDLIKSASPHVFAGYWIGGTFDTNSNYWVWQKTDIHGHLVNRYMDTQDGYYNWGVNEPSQEWPWLEEYSVAVMVQGVTTPWKWYSMNPNLNFDMSYICEADYKQQ